MTSLIYQINAQSRISKNLKEVGFIKVIRAFWAFLYLFKGIYVGFSFLKRQQICSTVIYRGERWIISNWASQPYVNLSRNDEYAKYVPQEQIEDVISLREFIHRFKVGFTFYLDYWYQIDIQRRLYFNS